MKKESEGQVPLNIKPNLNRFQFVTSTRTSIRGQFSRDPAGVRITPNGTTYLNVGGSDLARQLVEAGNLKSGSFAALLGGDPESGQVAVVFVDANTPGAKAVRQNADTNTLTLYLQDIFVAMPKLRPTTEKWCTVSQEPDGQGGNYLLIHLNVALERRTAPRRKSRSSPGAPVAAAKTQSEG